MIMAIKTTKLCVLLYLLSLFLVSATLSLAHEADKEENQRDPERQYHQCQRRCQQQEKDPRQLRECRQHCEEKYKGEDNQRDPQREYRECQQRCEQQDPRQRPQCRRRCEEQRERSRGGGNELFKNTHRRERRYEEREEEEFDNPYLFRERSFSTKFRSDEGRIAVLERFSRRSELLRGLDNYRLACLEASPNTFVLPMHKDAEAILLVVKGKGTITMVRHNDRETYNLECGDVIRVPAGTTTYLINRDNSEKIKIAKILHTVSTPGRFKQYFVAGGENPESYLRAFSDEILQAAFNTRRERIDEVLGQQREGAIVRASDKQIKELTRHASESSQWRFGTGESRGPYNLFNKRPDYSNNYGQLYLVKPEDYRQLQEMDVSVCAANISQGAIMGPFFNTRSTKVVVVTHGSGHVEMACPHLTRRRQEEEEEGEQYEQIRAHLSPKSVFIVPAGHPVVFVASRKEDLQLIAFGINAEGNHENFLAGRKRNVLQQIERQALELAFAAPGKEVEEFINSQDESIFFPGPSHPRRQPLNSILEV